MSYEVTDAQSGIAHEDHMASQTEPQRIWCTICGCSKESDSVLVIYAQNNPKEAGLHFTVCDDHSKEEAQAHADEMTKEAVLNQDTDTFSVATETEIQVLCGRK